MSSLKSDYKKNYSPTFLTLTKKLVLVTYWILFMMSWILYFHRPNPYQRPFLYFVILGIMSVLVLIATFCFDLTTLEKLLVIFQILLISFSFNLSELLLYPTVTGVDPWGHKTLTLLTLWHGHLPAFTPYPFEARPYIKMPGFHMLMGISMIMGGLQYKWASFIVGGVITLFLVSLLIYGISLEIFNNPKLGLTAVLLFNLSDNVLDMTGITIIPNTIGILLALFALYFLLKFKYLFFFTNNIKSIFFLLAISLLFIHTLGYAFLLLAIFTLGGIYVVLDPGIKTPFRTFVILLLVLSFFEWGLLTGYYMVSATRILLGILKLGHVSTRHAGVPLLDVIISRAGMLVYFVLFGISFFWFVITRRDFKDLKIPPLVFVGYLTYTAIIVGVGLLGTFVPTLTGILHRFWAYGEILASVIVGLFLFKFYISISKRSYSTLRNVVLRSLFLLFIYTIIMLMVLASVCNEDNPLVPAHTQRTGLYLSEVSTANFVDELYSANISIPVASDFLYIRDIFYIHTWHLRKPEKLPAVYPRDFEEIEDGGGYMFIFRVDLMKTREFPLGGRWDFINYTPVGEKIFGIILQTNLNRNLIYTSGTTLIFD